MKKESLRFKFETAFIPSVNNTYMRAKNGGVFKRDEVKTFQLALGYYALRESRKNKFALGAGENISIRLVFSVKNINRDLDNMIKATLDSLQGVLFRNDSQIYHIEALKEKANRVESIEIEINKLM